MRLLALPLIAALSLGVACDKKPGAGTTQPAPKRPLDVSHVTRVPNPSNTAPAGFKASNKLPFTLQKGLEDSLELDETGNRNIIINGDATLDLKAISTGGLEPALRINEFLTTPDTQFVQVDVGPGVPSGLAGKSANTDDPPALIDSNGSRYIPVGYFYQDVTKLKVRFTPGNPVQKASELPKMSQTRVNQKMTLLFRVTRGVDVRYFTLANDALVEYEPPVRMK